MESAITEVVSITFSIQREPSNPYDSNAVRVLNVHGEQVGHIKREQAAALAKVIDGKLGRVEG